MDLQDFDELTIGSRSRWPRDFRDRATCHRRDSRECLQEGRDPRGKGNHEGWGNTRWCGETQSRNIPGAVWGRRKMSSCCLQRRSGWTLVIRNSPVLDRAVPSIFARRSFSQKCWDRVATPWEQHVRLLRSTGGCWTSFDVFPFDFKHQVQSRVFTHTLKLVWSFWRFWFLKFVKENFDLEKYVDHLKLLFFLNCPFFDFRFNFWKLFTPVSHSPATDHAGEVAESDCRCDQCHSLCSCDQCHDQFTRPTSTVKFQFDQSRRPLTSSLRRSGASRPCVWWCWHCKSVDDGNWGCSGVRSDTTIKLQGSQRKESQRSGTRLPHVDWHTNCAQHFQMTWIQRLEACNKCAQSDAVCHGSLTYVRATHD